MKDAVGPAGNGAGSKRLLLVVALGDSTISFKSVRPLWERCLYAL
jgi:hypothetical protein